MAEIAALAAELAGEIPAAKEAASPEEAAGADVSASLFGVLDSDQRIRTSAEQNERTLWASAVIVTLLYVAVVAAYVMGLGGLSGLEQELARQEQERRGQDSTSISVELVPTRTRIPRPRSGRTARSRGRRPIRRRRNRSSRRCSRSLRWRRSSSPPKSR